MKHLNVAEITDNFVNKIDKQTALVTARKKDGTFNMCTVSWASIGRLWRKNIITIYIKPIRFTDSFIIEDNYFTLSFLDNNHHNDLILCGTKSGKNFDKIKNTNLKPIFLKNGITFEDYDLVFVLKKIYQGKFNEQGLISKEEIINRYYVDEPFHNVYIGEIVDIISK